MTYDMPYSHNVNIEYWEDYRLEEIYALLKECLSTPYNYFVYKHQRHPYFQKELFFVLNDNGKLVSTFACRPVELASTNWRVMLFGDVATSPSVRNKGYMSMLVKNALIELQSKEKVDIIMNQWTMESLYKGMYSKFGFSTVENMRTMINYRKQLSTLAHSIQYKNEVVTLLHKIQDTLIRFLFNFIPSGHRYTCQFVKLSNLSDSELQQVNRLYENSCRTNSLLYVIRDRGLWEYLVREKFFEVVYDGNQIVAYAISSQQDKDYIIEELISDNWDRFIGSLMTLEQNAASKEFHAIEVFADRQHWRLPKYKFNIVPMIRSFPLDPRCRLVFRLLKNFILKMHSDMCTLKVYDEFLEWEVTVGSGTPQIKCSQKTLADLLGGGTVGKFLRQANISSQGQWTKAKHAMEDIKRRYQIPVGFRCYLDRY